MEPNTKKTEVHSPSIYFQCPESFWQFSFSHTHSEIAGGDYLWIQFSISDGYDIETWDPVVRDKHQFVSSQLGSEHWKIFTHRHQHNFAVIAETFEYSITDNGKKLNVNLESGDGSTSIQIEAYMDSFAPDESWPSIFHSVQNDPNNDERYPGLFEDFVFDAIKTAGFKCNLRLNNEKIKLADEISGIWWVCSAANYRDGK